MILAPELIGLAGSFLLVMVCVSLLFAYRSSLGALLRALAAGLHAIDVWGVRPFDFVAKGVTWVDQQINNALAAAVTGAKASWHAMLTVTGQLLHETAKAVDDLAKATYGAISHTVDWVIPNHVAINVRPLRSAISLLQRQVGHLLAEGVHTLHTVTHTVTVTVPKVITRIERQTVTVVKREAVKAAGTIANPWPRIRTVEHDLDGLKQWVRGHTKDATVAGLAALMIGGVLARMGMSWLRCSNVAKAGKSLCGMNAQALEGLLAGLLSIFGTLSLVTFSKQIQAVLSETAGEVTHLWRADVTGPGGDRAIGSATLK